MNVVMQELLVRGYLYRMIRQKHNTAAAVLCFCRIIRYRYPRTRSSCITTFKNAASIQTGNRCFLQMTHLRNVRFASVFSAYSTSRLRFAVGALIMIRNLLAFVDRYRRVSRPPPTQAPRRKCGTPRHRCRGCGGLPAPHLARRGSPSARHRGCLRPVWRRSRRIRRRPG